MALLRMVTRHGDGCARCKRSACSCDDNGGGCRRCRGQLGAVLESVLVVLVLVPVVAPVPQLGAVLVSVLVVLVLVPVVAPVPQLGAVLESVLVVLVLVPNS